MAEKPALAYVDSSLDAIKHAIEAYEAHEAPEKTLPRAFVQIAARLPLVVSLLEVAREVKQGDNLKWEELRPTLSECEDSCRYLETIFDKARPLPDATYTSIQFGQRRLMETRSTQLESRLQAIVSSLDKMQSRGMILRLESGKDNIKRLLTAAIHDRQQDSLDRIRRAYKARKLVFVVGAGVTLSSLQASKSSGVSAVRDRLTWPGLLLYGLSYISAWVANFSDFQSQMFDLCCDALQDRRETLTTNDLILIATFVKDRLQERSQLSAWLSLCFRQLYTKFMQDEEIDVLEAIKNLHRGGARIMTTNYDDTIERYCATYSIVHQNKPDFHEFVYGTDDGMDQGILHVHGHWKDAEHAVLDKVDYSITTANEPLQVALRSLFHNATLVFVGTGSGLDDPNFGGLMKWARTTFKGLPQRHYILVRDGDRLEDESVLARVSYGPQYSDLPSFLRLIANDM